MCRLRRQIACNACVTQQLGSYRNNFHFLLEQQMSSQIVFCLQTNCQRAIKERIGKQLPLLLAGQHICCSGGPIFFSNSLGQLSNPMLVTQQLGSGAEATAGSIFHSIATTFPLIQPPNSCCWQIKQPKYCWLLALKGRGVQRHKGIKIKKPLARQVSKSLNKKLAVWWPPSLPPSLPPLDQPVLYKDCATSPPPAATTCIFNRATMRLNSDHCLRNIQNP